MTKYHAMARVVCAGSRSAYRHSGLPNCRRACLAVPHSTTRVLLTLPNFWKAVQNGSQIRQA